MKARILEQGMAGLLAILLAAAVVAGGWPTVVDPNGPNSGAGRHPFTGEPTSGPGGAPWGDPASDPGHSLR